MLGLKTSLLAGGAILLVIGFMAYKINSLSHNNEILTMNNATLDSLRKSQQDTVVSLQSNISKTVKSYSTLNEGYSKARIKQAEAVKNIAKYKRELNDAETATLDAAGASLMLNNIMHSISEETGGHNKASNGGETDIPTT